MIIMSAIMTSMLTMDSKYFSNMGFMKTSHLYHHQVIGMSLPMIRM